MGGKGKLDNSKQSKAQNFVNGWVSTSTRLVIVALIIIGGVIALTILWSFIGPTKFLNKHPTRQQVSNNHIEKIIKQYKFPK